MAYKLIGFGADCSAAADAAKRTKEAQNTHVSECKKFEGMKARLSELEKIYYSKGLENAKWELEEILKIKREIGPAEQSCVDNWKRAAQLESELVEYAECFSAPQPAAPPPPAPADAQDKGGTVSLPEVVIKAGEEAASAGKKLVEKAKQAVTPSAPPAPRKLVPWGPCPPSPARTRPNQRGQAVYCWQKFLMSKGQSLAPYGADGVHGPITEKASLALEGGASKPAGGGEALPSPPTAASLTSDVKSMLPSLPKQILGMPTPYALGAFAALAVGGYWWLYVREPQDVTEE